MSQFNLSKLSLAAAVAVLSMGAQADVLTQWSFNNNNLLATTGAGTASLVGGTTGSFASGAGSTDTNGRAWNTTNYAAQGTGDKTRGVQFSISTLGFENISFSYDSKHSGTASANELIQYSIDGLSFTDLVVFNSVDTNFANGRLVDLSNVAAVNNQANLSIRIVSTFAPGGNVYAGTTSTYGTGGTMRFDQVTFNGTVAAVPEPTTYAMLLAGLGCVGFIARRRKAA